ncbi:MAG: alcohol dehydrogenase catalytic domain-containing protein [Acidobacteriota bacterium]
MRAIAVLPGKKGPHLIELPNPPRIGRGATEVERVVIKVKEVGISAIDRRIASGEHFEPPKGATHFVLGHEMLGRVVDVEQADEQFTGGNEIHGINIGDLVVPQVRHGCGQCIQCARGNTDYCLNGLYQERGIHQLDGFMSDYVMESARYLIKVPSDLEDVALLLPSLAIAEKAVSMCINAKHAMDHPWPFPDHSYHFEDWGEGKAGVVWGGTDIAVLIACLLVAGRMKTFLIADNPSGGTLASIVRDIGAVYVEQRGMDVHSIVREAGRIDMIYEASGSPAIDFQMTELMGRCCILTFTTTPAPGRAVNIDANGLMRQCVIGSQSLVGVSSASRQHYEQALKSLRRLKEQYGSAMKQIITHRYDLMQYQAAFAEDGGEAIKSLLTFGDQAEIGAWPSKG